LSITTQPLRLGWIGLGIMGIPSVQRLREQGFPVAAWNRTAARYEGIRETGAVWCDSPRAVAESADIVFLCVLDARAVEQVVLGPDGIAGSSGPARVVVDMSTIDPEDTLRIAGELRRRNGMHWVDAPVSGGPLAARAGSLTVMAGGEPEDIAYVEPAVRALAARFTHMGPLGAGQTTKVINQLIVGVGFLVMAEALALAERAGIDADRLPDALAGGLADSALLQRIYPQMRARDFVPPRSHAKQLLKDLVNVVAFAERHGLDLPVVRLARDLFRRYVEAGHGEDDSASVCRLHLPD